MTGATPAAPDRISAQAPQHAPPAAPRPTYDRLPSLTGLRWLAAFMVFGFHMGTLDVLGTSAWHRRWDLVFGQGASGVSFFFILSGFVLVWAARPGDGKRAFWQRRLAKIYPNHVVTWALVIAVTLAWGASVSRRAALANLALIHPWLLHGPYLYSINTVSWSLGCEAFFYACFPFGLLLLRRMRPAVLAATAVLLAAVLYEAPILMAPHFAPTTMYWFTYMCPLFRSLEFWLGAAVGQLVVTRAYRGPGLWTSTALVLAVYAGNRWIPVQYWNLDLDVVFVLLIAAAAGADLGGARSPWRYRPLVWLGEVSFAFYMVHVQLVMNVMRLIGRTGSGWHGTAMPLALLVLLGGAVLTAWLLYRAVEVPMTRRLRPRSTAR